MSDYYVSSDYHDQHTNICGPTLSRWEKGYRDFSSLEQMRNTILDNLNNSVAEDDVLFFLGDSTFGMNKFERFAEFWDMVKCRNIIYIRGNHDDWMLKEQYKDEVELIVGPIYEEYNIVIDGQKYNFHHYGPEERKITRELDTIYCYAHYHSIYIDPGFGIDVGIDTFSETHKKYTPYSIKEILKIMKLRGYK